MSMKSFKVGSGIAVALATATDIKLSNGVARASLAIQEDQDVLMKKGMNLALAIGAKLVADAVAPDTIIETATNVAVAVTGVAMGHQVYKTSSKALALDEDKVKDEIERLSNLSFLDD